ncbi:sulfate transporter [Janthinobacterium sp. Marseille]|nr:SulP family inorganic anion transporter [Janthinobacterium sp. Marseille]ABR89300.1 sulfate transporter [Janthinobacterium sp. Marseille]
MSAVPQTKAVSSSWLKRCLPILDWAPKYQSKWLGADLLAGVTVAAFCIPESMAYAGLAGLPPQAGLYASLLAVFAYVFFGTSKQAAIGPTSALAILVATGLAGVVSHDPARYGEMAALLAILVGLIAIVARVLRLGFLVNFISESVLTGFSAGAAIYIGTTQLGKLFGIEGANGEFIDRIVYIAAHLGETNFYALGLGVFGIAFLLVTEKLAPKVPWALVLVAISILLMIFTALNTTGIKITGQIPTGLPPMKVPSFTMADVQALLPTAFAVFLLSYVEGMGVVRTFAAKHKYPVDANQELLAVGAANVLCGLGAAQPVGCSMSRSAVNDEAGAKTPLAGAICGILLGVIVLFFTGVFTNLPEPVLAAVVIIAVKGLIDIPALMRLYRVSPKEFWIALAAMLGVLVFGMLEGVMIGTVLSLLMLVWRASNPSTVLLGRIPGSELYSDLARHPENETVPGIMVFRANSGLFYANIAKIKDDLLEAIERQAAPVKLVIFDLSSSPYSDIAAAEMLLDLQEELQERGITLKLSNLTGEVRDLLRRDGLDLKFDIGPRAGVESIVREWSANGGKPVTGRLSNLPQS